MNVVKQRRQGPRTQKIGVFSPLEERRGVYGDEILALQGEEFVWDFAVLDKANRRAFWKATDKRFGGVLVREDDIR